MTVAIVESVGSRRPRQGARRGPRALRCGLQTHNGAPPCQWAIRGKSSSLPQEVIGWWVQSMKLSCLSSRSTSVGVVIPPRNITSSGRSSASGVCRLTKRISLSPMIYLILQSQWADESTGRSRPDKPEGPVGRQVGPDQPDEGVICERPETGRGQWRHLCPALADPPSLTERSPSPPAAIHSAAAPGMPKMTPAGDIQHACWRTG